MVNAQNPTAFGPVIERAKEAGVVLVAFDNILDTQDAINVNVDQKGLGRSLWAKWLDKHLPNGGKVLEVRGVAGTSVDTDRHNGIHETFGRQRQEVGRGREWSASGTIRPRRRRPPMPSRCTRSSTASPRRVATPAWCRR